MPVRVLELQDPTSGKIEEVINAVERATRTDDLICRFEQLNFSTETREVAGCMRGIRVCWLIFREG